MAEQSWRPGRFRLPSLAIAGLLALAGCARGGLPDPPVATGDRLARTLGILRAATPARPQVLRILFYGQSISNRAWTDLVAAHLRRRWPNVRFVVTNLAIGGFSANLLERTAARDLAEAAPDLVVFHVYGDHRAYERIIRTIRSETAAEVIVQTDHVTTPVEPACVEGLRLTLARPPGCTGRLWLRQHDWGQHMSATVIPALARRYGLVVEPQRDRWDAYLRRNRVAPGALLADGLHPNARGWRLMAAIFDGWFDRLAATVPPGRQATVTDLPPPAPGAARTYPVDGSRIELIADGPLAGRVAAAVDGRPPTALDGCWQTGRTSLLPGPSSWPAIRQVAVDPAVHRPVAWRLDLLPDGARYRFTLRTDGRPDGEGTTDADFAARSGVLRIAARDWSAAGPGAAFAPPGGFAVRFGRRFACRDMPAVALAPGRVEQRFVVATGLPDGPHQVTLRLLPGAPAVHAVHAVRVYRPPLPGA